MKASLTLRKDDLLSKLAGRKDEINADYDKRVKEIDDEIAGRTDEATIVGDTAVWYQEVALGLADGTITLTEKGALRGATPKPKKGGVRPGAVVHSRRGRYNDWAYYSVEDLDSQRKQIERQRQAELKPVDTAMELIGMSVGETVEVDSADYQSLLNGTHRHW